MFVTQVPGYARGRASSIEDFARSARTTARSTRRRCIYEPIRSVNPCLVPLPSNDDVGSRHDKEGFRGLWRKVKVPEQPDDGIPFDTDDAMFNPPVPNFHEPPLTAKLSDVPRRPSVCCSCFRYGLTLRVMARLQSTRRRLGTALSRLKRTCAASSRSARLAVATHRFCLRRLRSQSPRISRTKRLSASVQPLSQMPSC